MLHRDFYLYFYLFMATSQDIIDAPVLTSGTGDQARKKTKKRSLAEVVKDIPDPKTVVFDPLCIPQRHDPILHLPLDLNTNDPFSLFNLFWPEKLWTTLATNTNLYAVQKRMNVIERQRPWHNTCAAELQVWVRILIYMGFHRSYSKEIYWREDTEKGLSHTCARHMGLKRYQAIKRYFHVSPTLNTNTYEPPTEEDEWSILEKTLEKIWWHKVEPLGSIIQDACCKYYTPSSEISINELMIRCYGRSQHTYKIPDKPIPMGYKLFAMADHSYIWYFTWSSQKHGLAELVKHKDLTPTGSMVLGLVQRLLKISGQSLTIYLNNYFTSILLFQIMRQQGIRACKTT